MATHALYPEGYKLILTWRNLESVNSEADYCQKNPDWREYFEGSPERDMCFGYWSKKSYRPLTHRMLMEVEVEVDNLPREQKLM